MREPNLEPTPRGWLDKVYDSGALSIMSAMVILWFALDPLSDVVGYWPALAIAIPAGIALAMLISLPFIRRQKKRAALDAEHGLFECADSESGSPLKRRWAVGYAKAEPGRLLFQAKTGVTGPLAGPIEIYSELRPIGQPVKAPWSAFPRGKVITLSTDKGAVELAVSPASLSLLAERCLSGG
jgi:hypothetical protein